MSLKKTFTLFPFILEATTATILAENASILSSLSSLGLLSIIVLSLFLLFFITNMALCYYYKKRYGTLSFVSYLWDQILHP